MCVYVCIYMVLSFSELKCIVVRAAASSSFKHNACVLLKMTSKFFAQSISCSSIPLTLCRVYCIVQYSTEMSWDSVVVWVLGVFKCLPGVGHVLRLSQNQAWILYPVHFLPSQSHWLFLLLHRCLVLLTSLVFTHFHLKESIQHFRVSNQSEDQI